MSSLKKNISTHFIVRNGRLEKHLESKFAKDRRKRKGLSNYIEELAVLGLDRIEKRQEGFSLHLLGKSDLPSIDLFHYFKMDYLEIEDAIRLDELKPEQVYNIDLTYKALAHASNGPRYRNCIESMKRKGYDWKDYVKP